MRERTNGEVGPDVTIEAAGVPVTLRQAIQIVRDGGVVIEVGHSACNGEVGINHTRIMYKALGLYGWLVHPPIQFETSISLLDQLRKDVPFDRLSNFQVGFGDAERAYEKQTSGEAYLATIHPDR